MAEAIDAPDEMSPFAPRIISIKIPVDKIGEVIGPKGKMINQIQDETGAEITIEDDGTIYIGATDGRQGRGGPGDDQRDRQPDDARGGRALPGHGRQDHDLRRVRLAAARARTACCTSRKLRELAGGKRVENVEDVVKVGQKIQVEIAEIDPRGKLSLIPVEESRMADGSPTARTPTQRRRDGRRPATRSSRTRRGTRRRRCPTRAAQRPGSTVRCSSEDGARLVRRTVLPGGLRVVTEAVPGRALGGLRRLGRRRLARRDAGLLAGASHFLEHLLFKGTAAPLARWRSPRRSTPSAAR